ncbi:MAG: hypothetical protein WCP34_16665, partial [Pseudomonadota bacterium]
RLGNLDDVAVAADHHAAGFGSGDAFGADSLGQSLAAAQFALFIGSSRIDFSEVLICWRFLFFYQKCSH